MNETDAETEAILQASRFWVQRVLVPITVVIGVVGNTVTVMVLTRKRMRSSTNVYLSALAIADIIYLFFVFLLSFKHYPNIHDGKYELYWRFLGLTYWFCDAASSTSVWLTVSFTIERYIAVCHPMKGKVFCTERRAKSIIVIVYIFCILTTASTTFEYQLNLNETCINQCENVEKSLSTHNSAHNGTTNHKFKSNPVASHTIFDEHYFTQLKQIILSNCTSQSCIICISSNSNVSKEKNMNANVIEKVPESNSMQMKKFKDEPVLEKPPYEAELRNDSTEWDNSSNKTVMVLVNATCCRKHYIIDEEPTNLGKNETYSTIINWYSSIFFWLIPLTLIAIFNSFLVRAVYLSQKIRRQMTNSQESIGLTKEKKITVMLIGVVILFMICNTPTGTILIYRNFHRPENIREENIYKILGNFFNFLGIVNASCNFLLYCFFSKKFRTTFKMIFLERKKKKQDVIMLSSTKSRNSQKFNPYKHGIMKRNASDYHTPRNLEQTHLLTGFEEQEDEKQWVPIQLIKQFITL